MDFKKYPYQDYNSYNLDYIIEKIGKVENADLDITTALNNSNEALRLARVAETNASDALNEANIASLAADDAMTAAQNASADADAAALVAGTASNDAATALSTAVNAKNTADGIAATANQAANDASDALTAANNAVNTANGIAGTANQAANDAADALLTAGNAEDIANGVASTANQASLDAAAAVATANAASAAIANIGTYTYKEPSGKSVANNTIVNLTSVDLTPGTYIIKANAQFGNNSTGYRELAISSSSSTNGTRHSFTRQMAASGAATQIQVMCIYVVSVNTTYYINARQTSGSTLTVTPGVQVIRII